MEQKDKNEIARIRWIRDHLREIAEDKDDLQENFTPLEVCDMMLDKIDLNSAKSILVLYNIEIIFALMQRKYTGDVTFFTSSLKKCEIAPKFLPRVKIEYIEKSKDPLQHLAMAFPDKFDIIIANPPYGDRRNTRLHLQFLEKGLHLSKDKVVFVHPANQYIDQKNTFGLINQKSSPFLSSLHIFNGNGIFGILKFFPIAIALFDVNKKGVDIKIRDSINNQNYVVKDLEEITVFGHSIEFHTFKLKMSLVSKDNNLQNNLINNSREVGIRKNFFVPVSSIRGNIFTQGEKIYKNDFFTILTRDSQEFPRENVENLKGMAFEFDTREESRNFIEYCKTDFARACLALLKTDNNLNYQMYLIPWMDFTQEWTNERLYKHFNITEEEQAFIKEIIPPYYDTGGTETED